MTIHPKLREVMVSTATDLQHTPDLAPEDAGKLKDLVVHLAAELEVIKAEPLPSTAATDD